MQMHARSMYFHAPGGSAVPYACGMRGAPSFSLSATAGTCMRVMRAVAFSRVADPPRLGVLFGRPRRCRPPAPRPILTPPNLPRFRAALDEKFNPGRKPSFSFGEPAHRAHAARFGGWATGKLGAARGSTSIKVVVKGGGVRGSGRFSGFLPLWDAMRAPMHIIRA